MVGGGPGAFIGEVHRKAARMDGGIEPAAGAFDIKPRKSKQIGRELGKDRKISVQRPLARKKRGKGNKFTRKKSKFCPLFNFVLLTVVVVTVLSLVVSLILSFSNPQSTHQEGLQTALFYTCSATWKMGVGVIFGLLGGKKFTCLYQKKRL